MEGRMREERPEARTTVGEGTKAGGRARVPRAPSPAPLITGGNPYGLSQQTSNAPQRPTLSGSLEGA